MIRLEHIGIVFNAHTPDENIALKDINLSINKGDFITVIGSNGAGKSTLYNIIAGTFKPTSGHLYMDDGTAEREITGDPEYKRARYIGRIFQNPLLGTAGKMRLEDNMMICCRKGWKGLRISLNNKMRAKFREQLAMLNMGLEDRLNDNVELLSGGQRQALTLLMATMAEPKLLLLDEHTAALDPKTAEKVLSLTREIVARQRLTTLMITHNMRDALKFGNRLIMMYGGKILFDIPEEKKKHLEVKDLLAMFEQAAGSELVSDSLLLS